jgi:electron transport complex protein RnfD
MSDNIVGLVSSSPHLRTEESIKSIMWGVFFALFPAWLVGIYWFGFGALTTGLTAIVVSMATEAGIKAMRGQDNSMMDGSAAVAGLLLAFNLPASAPWWMTVVGAVFMIAVVKEIFGGLGYNILNPALAARAFLLASWPVQMTGNWVAPSMGTMSGLDAVTTATPLNMLKQAGEVLGNPTMYDASIITQAKANVASLSDSYMSLMLGNVGGCIGETSVLALLMGGAFLIYKKYITWHVPVIYIATVGLLAWMFGGVDGMFSGDPLFHILSGSLILGAFYMATDMVTSPLHVKGKVIFAIGIGIFTITIRLVGGYPEGVSYAILLMNLTVPLLNRYARPKVFGAEKEGGDQ